LHGSVSGRFPSAKDRQRRPRPGVRFRSMATEGTATQGDETDAALEARLRRIYAIAGVLAVVWLALLAAGGIMVSNRILADRPGAFSD